MADYPQLHSMDSSPTVFGGGGRDNENVDDIHHDPLRAPTSSTHNDDFAGSNTILIEEEEDDVQDEPFLLPSSYARANEDFSNNNSSSNNNNNNNRGRRLLHYGYSVSRLLIVDVLLELTSADNTSLVSKLLRLSMTVGSYFLLYTTATGHLMWGIAYLNDHGWYLLAASGSITLLLISTLVLTSYEWMWRWQERVCLPIVRRISCCGNNDQSILEYSAIGGRRRMVVLHGEDDMEEDLSLRAWLRRFGKIATACVVWLFYCLANIKVDFWITDQYILARPQYHRYELQLVNGLEAAPILVGAALLLYWTYLPFYTWHGAAAAASSDGVILSIAQVDPEEGDTIRQREQSATSTQTLL
ncbi:hypothetical protein IV203_014035 [Nitzschia inconspicua]|uniref:Uncharacterized protein n=1 Tax=Nitzschia inconspicua TaxID=303405 RepID=A0A9K3M7T7_9STRA|nr:hypothetical protein IV203_014035 [Nitzschia inconspicua]